MSLLAINDLRIEFSSTRRLVRAVDGVSFSIEAGRSLALVGESGSGKSVTALSIARLLSTPPARYPSGEILLAGRDVLKANPRDLQSIRGGVVSYVFQEPGASLNPVYRVGTQIKEALKLHCPSAATAEEVVRLLKLVGVPSPEERSHSFPHQLSGGMQQRVMIAMAVASKPKLLIADEPTTALDVTIQAQVIELLARLKRQFQMSILLITHHLGIVGDLADDVAVMKAGKIVEIGPVGQVLKSPMHPYTRALIDAVPTLDRRVERLATLSK